MLFQFFFIFCLNSLSKQSKKLMWWHIKSRRWAAFNGLLGIQLQLSALWSAGFIFNQKNSKNNLCGACCSLITALAVQCQGGADIPKWQLQVIIWLGRWWCSPLGLWYEILLPIWISPDSNCYLWLINLGCVSINCESLLNCFWTSTMLATGLQWNGLILI